jgi:hypothetical protein
MSEVIKSQPLDITPMQQRFLGFVASHVHESEEGPGGLIIRRGVYDVEGSHQLFPFLGDIKFVQEVVPASEDEGIGEIIENAEVTYEDNRVRRLPWMEVEFYIDTTNTPPRVRAEDPEKPFLLTNMGKSYRVGDEFVAGLISKIELLEADGIITRKVNGSNHSGATA